eukprot:6209107-Pleurochrysis_carterae.AAC.1
MEIVITEEGAWEQRSMVSGRIEFKSPSRFRAVCSSNVWFGGFASVAPAKAASVTEHHRRSSFEDA